MTSNPIGNVFYFLTTTGGIGIIGIVIGATLQFIWNFYKGKNQIEDNKRERINRQNEEAEKTEEKVVGLYQDLNKGQEKKIESLQKQLTQTLEKINQLEKDVIELRHENDILKTENEKLLPFTTLMQNHEVNVMTKIDTVIDTILRKLDKMDTTTTKTATILETTTKTK